MKKITLEILEKLDACEGQRDKFAAEWPDGATVTKKNCLRGAELGLDFDWAAEEFLSLAARAEYERVRAPAQAEYERVRAPAQADFDKARAPALAEYKRVCAPALADFDKACALAFWKAWQGQEREGGR